MITPLLRNVITVHDVRQLSFRHNNCSVGYFPCSKSSKCILQRQWCDDVIDCPDGEDEDFRTCKMHYRIFLLNFFKRCKGSSAEHKENCTGSSCLESFVRDLPNVSTTSTYGISPSSSIITEDQLFSCEEEQQEPVHSLQDGLGSPMSKNANKFEKSPVKSTISKNQVNSKTKKPKNQSAQSATLTDNQRNDSFHTIHSDEFDVYYYTSYKERCNIESSESLKCHKAGLTIIPPNISSTIKKISLQRNNISEVEDESFRTLKFLTQLDLRDNMIDHIAHDAFDALLSLNCLHRSRSQRNPRNLEADVWQMWQCGVSVSPCTTDNSNDFKIDLNNNELSALPQTFQSSRKDSSLEYL
ncbi:hypothetical protein HELRODRAFT_158997 [Helobdella robusta]|uniref:Uncharacterized protein n=1 Tax=Helobdella robusta TaxID=6412 RepID=T1ENG9_HELRO|nr:hypothetical protein HELRODRAFT_158997 [Helobdella robusta]ESO12463.1 hypothetical protein HELRODRAFT_158997 [Helobdella robusta]